MKITKLVLVICLFSCSVLANEESAYAEVARLRQYVGGEDEGDLKVQPLLNQASQTKKKKQQPASESNEGF